MTMPAFQDRPPLTERVNAYDERHLATYVRLLMAEEEGADRASASGFRLHCPKHRSSWRHC